MVDACRAGVRGVLFCEVRIIVWVLLAGGLFFVGGCQKPAESKGAASGTIETDETRVASRFGGRVAEIFIQEGDSLKSNQMVVRLEAPELKARRDQTAALLAEWKAGARTEEIETAKAEADANRAPLRHRKN